MMFYPIATLPRPSKRFRRGITRVLEEVRWERYRQIDKGWTPDHDDQHNTGDMIALAQRRLFTASQTAVPVYPTRALLVESAAILVAAIECIDRRTTTKES